MEFVLGYLVADSYREPLRLQVGYDLETMSYPYRLAMLRSVTSDSV